MASILALGLQTTYNLTARLKVGAMKQVGRRDLLALALAWATFRFFTLVPVSVAGTQTAEDEPVHFRWQARQIEDYLNNIRTIRARFRQVSSTGDVAEGYLYIQRPGRIRVEYDPPSPILIVSDGSFLI
jgi:outer membrane lipoprotein-sorting protein